MLKKNKTTSTLSLQRDCLSLCFPAHCFTYHLTHSYRLGLGKRTHKKGGGQLPGHLDRVRTVSINPDRQYVCVTSLRPLTDNQI